MVKLFILIFLLLLSGCGGSSEETQTQEPVITTASIDLARNYQVISFTPYILEPSVNWKNDDEITQSIKWYGNASVFLNSTNTLKPTLLMNESGSYSLSVEFISNQGKKLTASTLIVVKDKQSEIHFSVPHSLKQFAYTKLTGDVNWHDDNESTASIIWSGDGTHFLDSTITPSPLFHPTDAGSYELTVQVTSNLGRILQQVLTIEVTDDPITFTHSPALQATLNTEIRLNHMINWHDNNETIKAVTWSGQGSEFISNINNLTALFLATEAGEYRLTQTVTSSLNRKISATINISVIAQSDEKKAPIYTAPTSKTLIHLEQYTVQSAIDWQNSNETTANIAWSGSGAQFLSNTNTLTPDFSASTVGEYTLVQTITSSFNRQVNAVITITVNDEPNDVKAPIYTAPTSKTLIHLEQYTVQSAIDWQNSNETTANIAWSGSGAQFLSNTNTLTPDFSASTVGEYTLVQTITSSFNRQVNAVITITVNDEPNGVKAPIYTAPTSKALIHLEQYTLQSAIDWQNSNETTANIAWSGTGAIYLSDTSLLNPEFSAEQVGTFTLTQNIVSSLGREVQTTITITVNDLPPIIRPSIELTASNTTPTLYDTITLTAQVSDSDGEVTKVDFYADNYQLASLTAAPYSITVTPQVGTHRYKARVFDNQGTYSTSSTVKVSVNNFTRSLATDIKNLSVKSNHPYLFINPLRLNTIKQKVNELNELDSWLASRRELVTDINDTAGIKALVDERTSGSITNLNDFNNDAMRWGINAYINESALSVKYAQLYIKSIMERSLTYPAEPNGSGGWVNNKAPNDAHPRGKVFALGVLYDWLYNELSEEDKTQIRLNILANLVYIDERWSFYSAPSYTGGHSRRANIAALTALLAIYHDIPNHSGLEKLRPDDTNSIDVQSLYYSYLQKIISHFENGYNPFLAWSSMGGGSEKGWTYGTSYASFDVNYLWRYATDESSWFAQWHKEKASFYLYGLRNLNTFNEFKNNAYHNFPYSGDVWSTDYTANFQGVPLMYSASEYKDQHAQWLYENMPQADSIWKLLYADITPVTAKAPTELPLSKHFAHAGIVTMRDSWQVDKNTLAVFKSSSFSSINHHHRDQNAFTIFYKGPLAIDSGGYNVMGAYGSWHWWNYYTRSVAHNTITVYDPNESFGVRNYQNAATALSNDGGQIIKGNNYPTPEEVKPTGSNSLGGVVHYQHNNKFTYTMGDASLAYSQAKLEKFNRHFIMLPNHSYTHPVYLIYDEVSSKNKTFKKSYLLHSINSPEISENMVKLTIDSGIDSADKASLYQKTLLPKQHSITTVGGAGEEFLVWDNGNNTAHNYIDDLISPLSGTDQRVYRESGQWRIEVSPTQASKDDDFLHVIAITEQEGYPTESALLLPGTNIHPVLVKNPNNTSPTTLVAIVSKASVNEFSIDISNVNQVFDTLIVGLKPGVSYNIKKSDTTITITESLNATISASPQGTIYYAL
ncbi:hypothetical protein GCM10009111_28800 [Colwellia asteriadis]|uniref:Heparinase II/III-like C-terminal domain-containing protein n=1 Tax=Colwellia asteriadis TaxID=517723 RepID=A0ABN1L9T2_9GAMM